jgi:peroxiredoxin
MQDNQKVDAIHVKDFDGNQVDLISKYRNKILLIILYNNDCLGCTGRAIPLAYEFQRTYSSIQVIGVHSDFENSVGTQENIKKIFTSGEIPFPIYIDERHRVYDQFHAEGTPQWLLISSDGNLYRSIFGSQGGSQNRLYYAIEAILNS